jgi:Transcriptional regulatory protein, C terminal
VNTCAPAENSTWPKTGSFVNPQATLVDIDSRLAATSEIAFGLDRRQYQVALVSLDTSKPGDKGTTRGPATPVLLLPLSWDELLRYVCCDAENPRTNPCADVEQFGDVRIDFVRRETRRADGPIEITSLEFKLLRYFLSNPYRVISREELLDRVWGYQCYPSTRAIDNKIRLLRKKLESDPANPVHFQTVYGVGYKFVP